MDPNEDLPCHSRKLVEPIELMWETSEMVKKLHPDIQMTKGQLLKFTEAAEDYRETYDADQDYNIDDVAKYTKLDLLDVDDSGSSLEKYKQNMMAIPYGPQQIQDGKLMKKIKERGFGDNPAPGSIVQVHYVYYTDLQELPIDVSYLRKKFPEKFQLGTSTLIVGLEYAILSMKKGEKSDFCISHELCFGEMGCPPRITAKADLLFEINLVNILSEIDLKSSADLESGVMENQTKEPTFQKILKRVEELGASAKNDCNNNNMVGAAKRYREAVKLLDNAQVADSEEQVKQEEYLCKMFRNLIICYNRMNQFKRSIVCARNACQFANIFAEKDMKLFFLWGKALSALQDWDSAIIKFNKALKLATNNKQRAEIEKEILAAQTKKNNYKETQKELCQRMLSISMDEEGGTATRQITQNKRHSYTDFAKLMEINLSEFKMSDSVEKDVLGPTHQFCQEEIDIVTTLANKMELVCTIGQEIVITKRS